MTPPTVAGVEPRAFTALLALPGCHQQGPGWLADCPCCDDRSQHLSIRLNEAGAVLVHCHRCGAKAERVLPALGLSLADLYPPKASANGVHKPATPRLIVATYDYTDEAGTLLYQVVRYDPKDFRQRRPDGHGGWVSNLTGVRRVLYRLPELQAADPAEWVFLPEGEKDADNLAECGLIATTNPMGAEKWEPAYTEMLRGRRVVILPDNDPKGEAHAAKVACALAGVAASVRVLRLPGLPPKGDVSDWLAGGGNADELRRLAAECPEWEPPDDDTGDEPELLAVPPFPKDVLPDLFRRYGVQASTAANVPLEAVALLLLAVVGGLLGNRYRIAVRAARELSAVFWVVLIGLPGVGKTPAIDAASAPLVALQREARDAWSTRLDAYEREHATWEAQKPSERGPEPKRPPFPLLYTSDTTIEALAEQLAASIGVPVVAEELLTWSRSFDLYRNGQGSDRQRWLSLWSGSSYPITRKGKDPVFIDRPHVPVVGGLQPARLAELADDLRAGDGFFDRLIPIWPDWPAPCWTDDDPDPALLAEVVATLRTIRNRAAQAPEPLVYRLEADALRLWKAWFDTNAALKHPDPALAGPAAKAGLHAARLALLLHVLAKPNDPPAAVPVGALADALRLWEWCRQHIGRTVAYVRRHAGPGRGLRGKLYALLTEAGGWVGTHELHRQLGNNYTAERRDAALAELLADDLVERRQSRDGEPGRPAIEWRATAGRRIPLAVPGVDVDALCRELGVRLNAENAEIPPLDDIQAFSAFRRTSEISEPKPEPALTQPARLGGYDLDALALRARERSGAAQ